MPSVKDYDHKKKTAKKVRRRPGRDHVQYKEVEEEAEETTDELSGPDESVEAASEEEHIHIEFPYSDLLRARVPKAFELAETVATEWSTGGDFRDLPIGPPIARMTVGAGLRKAKAVEKKLDDAGVISMARMGVEFAKSKLKR